MGLSWTAVLVTWWAAVATLVLAVWTWLWVSRLRCSAPGPMPLPLIGNALNIGLGPLRVSRLKQFHKRYGDVFRLYIGPKLCVVVTQPEDARSVLVAMRRRQRDPFFMHPLRLLMGDGLITCDWNTRRAHRRLVEPIFRTGVLERFVGALHAAGAFLCDRLETLGGAEADLYQPLFQATLRGLLDTVFGVHLDCLEPHPSRQADLVAELTAFINSSKRRVYEVWTQTEWTGSKEFAGFKTNRRLRIFDNLVSSIAEASRNKEQTLVNLMSETLAEHPPSTQEVHDEIRTFIVAGAETTTCTLGYVLVLLALNPEWQEAACKELNAVFGAGTELKRPVTTEDLAHIPVIESIIKEALRLFPVVPSLPTLATADIVLAGGSVVAPRGCCVVVAPCLTQRQQRFFPNPESFDPARFLPGGSAFTTHPYSYLPFGAGLRRCVGSRLAMMQMMATLSAVLRRFQILPVHDRTHFEDFPLFFAISPDKGFRGRCVPKDHTLLD